MVNAKQLNLKNIFVFLFLILFPFGQIIRIGVLQPIDIAVGLGSAVAVLGKYKRPHIFGYLENFLLMAGFSWIFAAFFFRQKEIFYGLLYFIRLAAYFYFLIYVWNFAKEKKLKNLLFGSLLSVSLVSALFGWFQYFAFPFLKAFTVWGWDDHLYRLAGTFLDPTFLGIIIVFGLLFSLFQYFETKKRIYLFSLLFLLISLGFTYSRASYLAFLAGLAFFGLYKKQFKQIILVGLGLIFLVLILPTSGNKILRITREFSAVARIENYKETLEIFVSSPVFGIGYNNLCLAKAPNVGAPDFASHSCSGSDSSILYILVTTGIVGLMVFVDSIKGISDNLRRSKYKLLLGASFAALLVHSLFSNSLVYSWVLGWMIVLLAISL